MCGIEPWARLEEVERLTRKEMVERELAPEEMEIYNPILKDKKKKRTKEEEEALVRSVKEEKVFEDLVFSPSEHSTLWVSLANGVRVFLENERVVSSDFLQNSGVDFFGPLEKVFGIQGTCYETTAVTNVAFPNGLVVKVMKGGDLLMKNFEGGAVKEQWRLVCRSGTVISYREKDQREVMMSNGNRMSFDGQATWTTTNNKGLRKSVNTQTGLAEELPAVPVVAKSSGATQKYPEIWRREDGVTTTIYETGDRLVRFEDGTSVLTSSYRGLMVVECTGYPPVRLITGSPQGEIYQLESALETGVRGICSDEGYTQILFPEGSRGYVYTVEGSGWTEFAMETVEGAALKTDSEGHAVLIPAECRWGFEEIFASKDRFESMRDHLARRVEEIERTVSGMQEAVANMSRAGGKGAVKKSKKQIREERELEEKRIEDYAREQKEALGAELEAMGAPGPLGAVDVFSEYVRQLLEIAEEDRACGVFSFDINNRSMWTKDFEERVLTVHDNGEYNLEDHIQFNEERYREYFDLYGAPSTTGLHPTLLVFKEGRPFEILNEAQVAVFLRSLQFDSDWIVQNRKEVRGYKDCEALACVKRCEAVSRVLQKTQEIAKWLPKKVDLQSAQQKEREKGPTNGQGVYYLFRELWMFKKIDSVERRRFEENSRRYREWLEWLAGTHYKVGYPNRFAEGAEAKSKEEASIEKRALSSRQAHFKFDGLQEMMKEMSDSAKTAITERFLEEIERAKTRIEQIAMEFQIMSRLL